MKKKLNEEVYAPGAKPHFMDYINLRNISSSQMKDNNVSVFVGLFKSDQLLNNYTPDKYDIFVAVGYQNMNKFREEKCALFSSLGYTLASYIDPKTNIPKNCNIGFNSFLMSNVLIHPFVDIGNNVFVWSGAIIGHHSNIKDNCWLTSGCNISGNVSIGRNCFIAVNSTIGDSIDVGNNCFLGANTLLLNSTTDDQVFIIERTKAIRLSTKQFLKVSRFDSI